MFISPAVSRKSQGYSSLENVESILQTCVGRLGMSTPEERAFSLAVELNDSRVAGSALARLIARRGAVLPLTVKGLWLQVGMALRAENERATSALLNQIVSYN